MKFLRNKTRRTELGRIRNEKEEEYLKQQRQKTQRMTQTGRVYIRV